MGRPLSAPPGLPLLGFGGSRAWPVAGPAAALPALAVRAAAAAGAPLAFSCAVGACALALCAGLRLVLPPSSLLVFAAFGPGGVGSFASSAAALVAAAARVAVPVVWWAGGRPPVPPRARLARRGAAFAGACSGGLVLFAASPSPGSVLESGAVLRAGAACLLVAPPAALAAWPVPRGCSWLPACSASGALGAVARALVPALPAGLVAALLVPPPVAVPLFALPGPSGPGRPPSGGAVPLRPRSALCASPALASQQLINPLINPCLECTRGPDCSPGQCGAYFRFLDALEERGAS